MINWNDLQFFLAVHRTRTHAGAAHLLKVERTTVGRRLAALEQSLGAKLFARTPEGLSPTAMGDRILALAEKVEGAVLQIERLALAADERAEGVVRLTTSESFVGLLGRWLAEMRGSHPRIEIELLAGNARLSLLRREADLAVRFARTDENALVCRRVALVGWAVYASRAYLEARGPLPATDALAGHDVIGFDESLAHSPGAVWIAEHGAGANVVLRSGSIPAACTAAAAGLGVALLPCFIADAEPALVRARPDVVGFHEGFLVVHPDLARVARIRVVMAFLVERFAATAATLRGEVSTAALPC